MTFKHIFYISIFFISACGSDTDNIAAAQCSSKNEINWHALSTLNCEYLSDYGLFLNPSDPIQSVKKPGIMYSLNSTLFTDFTKKYRFIFIPYEKKINYQPINTFDLPVGSVLVKFFTLPNIESEKILEVRLLIHRENGWIALPYLWDNKLKDAVFNLNGASIPFEFEQDNRTYSGVYTAPNFGDCQTCHTSSQIMQPIGPKARHLNKIIEYKGHHINQLRLWTDLSILRDIPGDLSSIDTAPNWQDESANLQNRAKAYLDINCAHCHNDQGSAALSGLRLEYWRKNISHAHGVCNSSHGWRGGGFDIWPGRGDISSIPVRMRHTQAKDRMPPIGRSLVHEEAAQLISDWIDSLPSENCVK